MFDPALPLDQNFAALSDYLQYHLMEVTQRLAHAAQKPCPLAGHWHPEQDKFLTGLTTLAGRYFLVRSLPTFPEQLFELHSVASDRGMEMLDGQDQIRFERANPADIVDLSDALLPFLHHTDHGAPEENYAEGLDDSDADFDGDLPPGAFLPEVTEAAREAFPRFAYRFQRFILAHGKELGGQGTAMLGVEHVYEHGGVFFLLVHNLPTPVLALFEDRHEWHERNVFDPEDAGVELLDSMMALLATMPHGVEAFIHPDGKAQAVPPRLPGGFSMN